VGLSAALQDKERLIRDISDTALWAAWYRANETAREDAVFRDPFALKLAGERGRQIAKNMKFSTRHSWSWVARTYLFDHMILEQIGLGVDMVVNLACGLDSRPYRMNLPKDLQWVEVDLPSILDYKEGVMQAVKPECCFERVRVNLADETARRELFGRLAKRAKNILVVTEGLITYFSEDEVAEFAKDLAENRSYQRWLTDLANPALIKLLNKRMGKDLEAAGALRFGPALGTKFFEPYGWTGLDVRSTINCAAKIKRLPRLMKLMTMIFPDSKGKNIRQPWSGAVMLGRI
jgi:methyltransferase (TIGR00027 family)